MWLGGGDAVLECGCVDECLICIDRLGAAAAAKNRIRVAFMVAGAVCA